MSRVYFSAVMPHKQWGALPTFSIETNDHTGGGYSVAGLHPTSIAALLGKGPEISKQERFDVKFNINGSRTSLSLVVNTTKHLPHVEWSSDGGLSKLPMAGLGALATQFFRKPVLDKATSRRPCDQKKSRHAIEAGRRSRVAPPREKEKDQRRDTNEPERSDSSDDGLGDAASSNTSHRSGRRHGQMEPRPTSRRKPQRSRESSHHSPVSRRATRKHDWEYDSGYASDGTSAGGTVKTRASQREERKRGVAGGRRRSD